MCYFLSALLFGTLLLCTVNSVPLHDESSADNTADGAVDDVLVKRLEKVLTNQIARVQEERKQVLKRKLLKQIEGLNTDDAEHLSDLLDKRRTSTRAENGYGWYCPWCDIGERVIKLIVLLCEKKGVCFEEFQDVMNARTRQEE